MPKEIVEIKRHYGFVHGSNPDPEAKEYFDMSYKAIGSFYKVFGKVFASGLTREEEMLLLPELLGVFPEDKKEFRAAVNAYYRNINTKVPPEGLKLNIGTEKGGAISDTNIPLNIDNYLTYRHAVKHPSVAMSKENAERMGFLAQFYIVDKVKEIASASKINKLEDDASMHYFEARDNSFKTEQMLTLMGIKAGGLTAKERPIRLKKLATIDPNQSDTVNIKRLEKFIAVAKDKDLATKYDIVEMVRVDILERVKMKYLDKESGEVIGDSLKETVLWFQDKGNSKAVNVYYARLDEIGDTRSSRTKAKEVVVEKEDKGTIVEASDSALSAFDAKEEDDKS
jgi:hypothetical protein